MKELDFTKGLNKVVMSNFDHNVNEEVVKKLKKNPESFALYAGWNFCGYVWWDEESSKWFCQVWQYKCPVEEISAETLEKLMEAVCDEYGNE